MLDASSSTQSSAGSEARGPGPHRTLADFKDAHRGASIVVCGCGQSLRLLERPERFVTIGVNDVGRLFTPDYLVVLNPPSQFSGDRFRYVASSEAKALFTHLADLPVSHPNRVLFRLGTYGGTDFSTADRLHYTQNSPYLAACLAVHMGARRIGLLGVDFSEEHFFGHTGPHALAGQLDQINRQYARLAEACRGRGVELVNLSPLGRLTALPRMSLVGFAEAVAGQRPALPATSGRRLFFVHHRFLSCGDVFREGLGHAAEELGTSWADAYWDDPGLPAKVDRFAPDLLFVVHGRNFIKRWGRAFGRLRSAVWLLDEPYEVDDTSSYSPCFNYVFVNDSVSLHRHHDSCHLPVCFDPKVHNPGTGPRSYDVGFIGGGNHARERLLSALAQRGRLDYVVGGPWRDGALRRLCLSGNVPASQTADLYRATKIVVNVFRDVHHFNRDRLAPVSLNPRIYEALACGALVVSERRPEVAELVPELPTFETGDELVTVVQGLLADPHRLEALRGACAERLKAATYSQRLRMVMERTQEQGGHQAGNRGSDGTPSAAPSQERPPTLPGLGDDWEVFGPVSCRQVAGALVLTKAWDRSPGAERGFVSRRAYEDVELSFEVLVSPGACFIAKVSQAEGLDQTSNSYHLYCDGGAYLARHFHVFRHVEVARGAWERLRITHGGGVLSLFREDRLLCRTRDRQLRGGYAFLGLKGGEIRLRNVRLASLARGEAQAASAPEGQLLHAARNMEGPRVSIVTTVYDRTDCLRRCIRSVRKLAYPDYEHVIVSDGPPAPVVEEIRRIVQEQDDGRISYLNLLRRFNNWGIAPAAAGLRRSRGEFVSFLSDDNGYLPDHLGPLVSALDRDARIGFAYSSCLYDGRLVLRHPVPRPGAIDLGQPLFRRELFELHFGDDIPFNVMAWDWYLIDALLRKGVRFKHVDAATFVFRLARYPQLVPAGS